MYRLIHVSWYWCCQCQFQYLQNFGGFTLIQKISLLFAKRKNFEPQDIHATYKTSWIFTTAHMLLPGSQSRMARFTSVQWITVIYLERRLMYNGYRVLTICSVTNLMRHSMWNLPLWLTTAIGNFSPFIKPNLVIPSYNCLCSCILTFLLERG